MTKAEVHATINGREYDTAGAYQTRDELQYACIFPLPEPRDCASVPIEGVCECFEGDFDRPLCEQIPGVGPPGTTQYWGKAYPGARQLQVLKAVGASSVVTSICPRNVSDADVLSLK